MPRVTIQVSCQIDFTILNTLDVRYVDVDIEYSTDRLNVYFDLSFFLLNIMYNILTVEKEV